jgi:hypothetical protein
MFRTILWVLSLALLCWIGYVVYDMTHWKNTLDPSSIFCQKDEQVLVIHKPNSFDWNQIEFSTLSENKNSVEPFLSILPADCDVYISKKRNLILIENSVIWTNSSINQLLTKANLRYSMQGDLYKIEQFNAVFKNNRILIYKYEEDVEGFEFDYSQLDRNATASIATLGNAKTNFIDIYLKNENTVEYHSKNANGIRGKLVEDQSVFQSYIPVKAENYCFYESTYLKSIDPVYAKGPICKWVESGFVSFNIDNKPVYMCQFIDGQNIVQNLNETLQLPEDNTLTGEYTSLVVSPKMGALRANYFVKTIDNMAVFSTSKEAVDLVFIEIELNKTWVYNDEDLNKLMMNLPKSVSYRSLGKFKNTAISVLGDKLIQTEVKLKNEKLSLNTDLEYSSIQITGKIRDFKTFNGKGNIVCLTEQGIIQGIENFVKTWKKNIGANPIGEIQSLKWNKEDFVSITTAKSIHLLDKQGKYLEGFPIKNNDADYVCPANVFINNGQIGLGIINSKNEIILYNAKGLVSKNVKLSEKDNWSQLDFFTTDSKLNAVIKGQTKVLVFSLTDNKLINQFPLESQPILVDKPNSALVVGLVDGYLKLFNTKDQQNENKEDKKITSQLLLDAVWLDSNLYSVSMASNKLVISSNLKEVLFEKEFGNTRISASSIYKNSYKEIYFSVVDGTENNVYLYDYKGRMYVKGVIGGSKKVSLNQSAGFSVTLTTIVDGYLVQYFIK